MNGITIRRDDGTHPVVERVFAYDPALGTALVLLKWSNGGSSLDRADVCELEALDAGGRSANLCEALEARAENLLVRRE